MCYSNTVYDTTNIDWAEIAEHSNSVTGNGRNEPSLLYVTMVMLMVSLINISPFTALLVGLHNNSFNGLADNNEAN